MKKSFIDGEGDVVVVKETVVGTGNELDSSDLNRRNDTGFGNDIGFGNDTGDYRSSKWFRAGRRAMLALIFLLPIFFLSGTEAPVAIAKTVLIYGIALFALIAYIAVAISHRQFSYPRSGFLPAVLFMLVVAGVSTWFSVSRTTSIFGNFTEPNSLLTSIAYGLLFFFSAYFFDGEDMPRIGKAFFFGAILSTILGLLQAFGIHLLPWAFAKQSGFTTVGSLYGWGVMMAMTLSALCVLPYAEFSKKNKGLAFIAGLLCAFGLLVLNYSTIWVGLAFLMIMISAARFVAEEKLGIPIVIAIASVCLALLTTHIPRIGSLPSEASPNFSVSWSVARHAADGKRLFIGTGPSTFGLDYSSYKPAELNQTNFWNVRFEEGYNVFTTALATQGLLGIVALLVLIAAFARHMVSGLYDPAFAPVTATLLMGMILWFFYPALLVSSSYLFIGFGLIASLGAPRREVVMRELRPAGAFVSFLALLLFAAFAVSSFYFLGQKYYAAYAYAKGTNAFASGTTAQGVAYLKSAVQWDSSSAQYARALSQGLLLDARNQLQSVAGGNMTVAIQQEIALAVQSAIRAIEMNPKDAVNYANAGGVYENLITLAAGAEQAAYASYESASKLDPVNPSYAYLSARVHVLVADLLRGAKDASERQSRLDVAKQLLEQSIKLKSDYADAHFLLAQIYLKEGDSAHAVERVEAIKATNPYDPGIAFQLGLLYYDSGQTGLAGTEFERAVSFSPDYANAMYFLGLVYDKQGKSDTALALFRRIGELNPDNAEVKGIIANLESGRHALQDIAPPATPPEKRTSVPVSEEKKKP